MARVEIVCLVYYPGGDAHSHSFLAHTRPVLFDLWARCPAAMLTLPSSLTPLTDLDAPLTELGTHVLVARQWTSEHRELRLAFERRFCA